MLLKWMHSKITVISPSTAIDSLHILLHVMLTSLGPIGIISEKEKTNMLWNYWDEINVMAQGNCRNYFLIKDAPLGCKHIKWNVPVLTFHCLTNIQLQCCTVQLEFCFAIFHNVWYSHSLGVVSHLNVDVLRDDREDDCWKLIISKRNEICVVMFLDMVYLMLHNYATH